MASYNVIVDVVAAQFRVICLLALDVLVAPFSEEEVRAEDTAGAIPVGTATRLQLKQFLHSWQPASRSRCCSIQSHLFIGIGCPCCAIF